MKYENILQIFYIQAFLGQDQGHRYYFKIDLVKTPVFLGPLVCVKLMALAGG